MSTTRIYTYFDNSTELPLVQKTADELGISLPQFLKYCTLLYVHKDEATRTSTIPMHQLLSKMSNGIDSLSAGTTFIVSSLFEPNEWANLTRSEKRALGCELKKSAETDKRYELTSQKRGTINQYRRL